MAYRLNGSIIKGYIMTKFNGHRNWNHWNVSLWINNDEGLYRMALDYIARYKYFKSFSLYGYKPRDYAAMAMLEALERDGITHTPDGAPYSVSSIRSAMVGM